MNMTRMRGQPVNVFNRYTGEVFEEAIYGEGFLRFAYETAPGRWLTDRIVSRPLLSRWYGWLMNRPRSVRKIRPFIKQYGLDPDDFEHPVERFRSFNEFFQRTLKGGLRPVDPDPRTVVFPADGRHMGWESLGTEQAVFVKGQHWDLPALLDDRREWVDRFSGGSLVISRLCPVDYHHFHHPVGGVVEADFEAGRRLYSVSPLSLRFRLDYLWQNRRHLTLIRSETAGLVCFIEVGATNVGSIRHQPLPEDRSVRKGEPKGWFEFGGSTVITLFEPGRVQLAADLLENTARSREVYAHYGDTMGSILQ